MKKITCFLKNNYHYIIFALTLIVSLCISFSADLFGDDYFYMKPAVSSPSVILQFLKWHIAKCNGRTLVHIFVILFLRNNLTVTLWRIFCGAGFASLCILIPKLIFKNGNRYRLGVCVASFVLTAIRTNIYNQSVYWLTASFNYLFPAVFLVIIMFISVKNRNSKWLLPLGFICGATMEQTGMMCIGWFALLTADELIQTKKFNKNTFVCFLLSVSGYLTIIFSPGTFSRISNQSDINTESFSEVLLATARKNWLDNISIYAMIALLAFSLCLWAFHFRKSNRISGIIAKTAAPLFFILFAANTLLRVYLVYRGMLLGNPVSFSAGTNTVILYIWIIYFALFILLTVYSCVMIYLKYREPVPVAAMILGLGSQLMMVITKTVITRACLPAIFMFTVYLVYSLVFFAAEISKKIKCKHSRPLARVAVCTVCVIACAFQLYSGVFGECLFAGEEQTIKPLSSEEMKQVTDQMDITMQTYYSKDNENCDLKINYNAKDFSLYK